MSLCRLKIRDSSLLVLLENIIRSFETHPGKGIPLGNLTSQLFANVYLDPLDQYAKRILRCKHYIRYTDDFVFLSHDRAELEQYLLRVREFLRCELHLDLHPDKVIFNRWHQGVDFLGFVHFPHFSVIRTKTKQRMLRKLTQLMRETEDDDEHLEQSKQSYLGVLSHARNKRLARDVRRDFRMAQKDV
jgi:hypothetical protein